MNENIRANDISLSLNDLLDVVSEVICVKNFKEIVTFEEIYRYAYEQKKVNPVVAAFIVSVKKNYDPKNDRDRLIVVQGLLDSEKKPISLNGKESESRIIHTGNIDKRFIDILNGSDTTIVMI